MARVIFLYKQSPVKSEVAVRISGGGGGVSISQASCLNITVSFKCTAVNYEYQNYEKNRGTLIKTQNSKLRLSILMFLKLCNDLFIMCLEFLYAYNVITWRS